jgi:hypothetical protein
LFGVVGESATQRWWSKFTDRFGTIVWKTRAGEKVPDERDGELATMLRDSPVDAVLVETGRLRRSSPVWRGDAVMVVVSLDGWRESPPADWTTSRHRISHAQLGGVTEGEFQIHIACRGPLEDFDWCTNLPGVPARLEHILTCTGSGRKVPIPDETPEGWTEDGRLRWEHRFKKIVTPTVFYKDCWVKRRLELKELKGVLDILALEECGTELRARMKGMWMPGKVYGALLSEISRGFKSARRGKRKRSIEEDKDHEDTTTEAEPEVAPSEGATIEPSGNKVSVRPTSLRET